MIKTRFLFLALCLITFSTCLRLRQSISESIIDITRKTFNELGLGSSPNKPNEGVFERNFMTNFMDRKTNITSASEDKAGLSLTDGAEGRTVSGEKTDIHKSANETRLSSDYASGTEIKANGGSGESANVHNSGNRIETSDYKIENAESSSSIIKIGPGGNAQSRTNSSTSVDVKTENSQETDTEKPEESSASAQAVSRGNTTIDIKNVEEPETHPEKPNPGDD
jgi:hypothetical protein